MDFSEDLGGLIDTVAMVRLILPPRCFHFATARTCVGDREATMAAAAGEGLGKEMGKKKQSISQKFLRKFCSSTVFLYGENGGELKSRVGGEREKKKSHHPVVSPRS